MGLLSSDRSSGCNREREPPSPTRLSHLTRCRCEPADAERCRGQEGACRSRRRVQHPLRSGVVMPGDREIRADFDRERIIVYQAYSPAIAEAALRAQKFVPPFSFSRMTWIKPSFLWLMHRSHWGQKAAQERVFAVRLTRTAWDKALALAVPTSFDPALFRSAQDWASVIPASESSCAVGSRTVAAGKHAALSYSSIQVGLQPTHHPGVRRTMGGQHRGLHAPRPEDLRPTSIRAGGSSQATAPAGECLPDHSGGWSAITHRAIAHAIKPQRAVEAEGCTRSQSAPTESHSEGERSLLRRRILGSNPPSRCAGETSGSTTG